MGLFSGSKKVYVSSTVYKMTDDGTDQSTFMQESIASAVLGGSNASLGEYISSSLLNGPRNNQRSVFRWAKNHYDFGMPRAAINYSANIDHSIVAQHIKDTLYGGSEALDIHISSAFLDASDESYFAEQFMFEHREELLDIDWAADYDPVTTNINIVYPAGTEYPEGSPIQSDTIPSPANFNSSDEILVVYYTVDNTALRVFIYKLGSGVAALDNFSISIDGGDGTREFYPPIPIRIDNTSVFAGGSPARTKESEIREAYSRMVGGDIDDLIESVEDNESIDDIDYAYVVLGVSLNDTTKHGKRYIFEFLRTLANVQQTTSSDFTDYQEANDLSGYHPRSLVLAATIVDALAPSGTDTSLASFVRSPQITNVHLTLPTTDLGVLDMKISWADIRETRHTGIMRSGAVVGDVDVFRGGSYRETVDLAPFSRQAPVVNSVDSVIVTRQISASEYIQIEAIGLYHKNLIYDGKSVDITGQEALEDPEESGFILPLHEPTVRRMGLVQGTELSRDCQLIVFNSYEVVKRKWYQTGIFKVLVSIVVVVTVAVLTVVTGGGGIAAAGSFGGLLGASTAVGAALGFTGLLGLAVGVAANVIAAMIVTQIVAEVGKEILGEKFAAILNIITQVALAFSSGQINFSSGVFNGSGIGSLLQLTTAAADIAAIVQQEQLEGIYEDIESITEQYNEEIDRLKEQYDSLGFGTGVIDPIMLTDFAHQQFGETFNRPTNFSETSDDFINRTLMTGSDLAELSLSLVNDFTDVSLTLQ